ASPGWSAPAAIQVLWDRSQKGWFTVVWTTELRPFASRTVTSASPMSRLTWTAVTVRLVVRFVVGSGAVTLSPASTLAIGLLVPSANRTRVPGSKLQKAPARLRLPAPAAGLSLSSASRSLLQSVTVTHSQPAAAAASHAPMRHTYGAARAV